MLDLYIKRIIIHQFSPNDTELVLAESPIEITPRLDEYFRKKLSKVFSDEAKRGYFDTENVFISHIGNDLMESSVKISKLWKEEFVISEDQKTNDLVFIQFDKEGQEYFAFLRIALRIVWFILWEIVSILFSCHKIICLLRPRHQMKLWLSTVVVSSII